MLNASLPHCRSKWISIWPGQGPRVPWSDSTDNKTGQTGPTLHTTLSVLRLHLTRTKVSPLSSQNDSWICIRLLRLTFTMKCCCDKVFINPVRTGKFIWSAISPSLSGLFTIRDGEERLTRVNWWITILNSNSRSAPAPHFVWHWSLITNNTMDIRRSPSGLYWQACKKLKTLRNYKIVSASARIPPTTHPHHINFSYSCFSAPFNQICGCENTSASRHI